MQTVKSTQILIIKPTRCTNFSNLFWNRTLHVSDSFSVHHQESSTVHTAIGICHTGYADCLLEGSGWNILILPASSQHKLYDIGIAVCTVLDSWWWPEKLPETCRVLFQNKFQKLVHLVGFIIRIYHDAWSSECQSPPRLSPTQQNSENSRHCINYPKQQTLY